MEGDKTGQEIYRHQVEIEREFRDQAELDRTLEHQHQTIFVRLAHSGEAIETDVAGAIEIDLYTALTCAFEDFAMSPVR